MSRLFKVKLDIDRDFYLKGSLVQSNRLFNIQRLTSSAYFNPVAYLPESVILTLLVWYKLAETGEVPFWEAGQSGTPKAVREVVKSLTGAIGNVDTTLLVAASKNGSDEMFESVLNAIRGKLSAQEVSGRLSSTIWNYHFLASDGRSSVSFRLVYFCLIVSLFCFI